MKRVMVYSLIILISFSICSQSKTPDCNPDSLKQLLMSTFIDTMNEKPIFDQYNCPNIIANSTLDSGMLAMADNNFEAAIRLFNNALADSVGNSQLVGEIYYLRGKCYFSLGKMTKALDDMEKSNSSFPGYINTWINLAFIFDSLDIYRDALDWSDSVLKYQDENYYMWYVKGNALNGLMQYEGAINSLQNAVKYKNDFYKAWFKLARMQLISGNKEEAIIGFVNALHYKHDFAEAWLFAGMSLMQSDLNPRLALSFIDSAIVLGHHTFEPWIFRGMLLTELGRYEEALESYDSVLAYGSDNDFAWINKAEVFDRMDRIDEEFACLDSAMEKNADRSWVWVYRASALIDLGKYEEALQNCDSAINYSPNFAAAKVMREILTKIYGEKVE